MTTEFFWRAEMACRAAWPAATETEIGGWIARRSGGPIRRVNSLNQLPGSQTLDHRLLDRVEAHYRQVSLPSLVRLMSFVDDTSRSVLERRGYQAEGHTTTLHAQETPDLDPGPDVHVFDHPDPDWLDARTRIAGADRQAFAAMLRLIAWPAFYAGAEADGAIQSVAYGVIVDRLLVIEAVATAEAFRGRGLARKMVGALMRHAASAGADQAVLQVVTDNAPARALYRSLGFTRELFDYAYMRRQTEGRPG